MKKTLIIVIMVLLGLLSAVACDDGAGDPAETVENYLQAKVDRDEETIRGLLCSEMESVLEREVRSFESVSGAEIEGLACQYDEAINAVRCQGTIVALYGTEESEFPLTSYRVVQEDGEWKWCGEAP
jgi:hypothetical protein